MSAIALPIPVQTYLDRFASRRRWQGTVRAAGIAAAGTIAWALAWRLIDRLLSLPFAVRAVALTINVGFIVTVLAGPLRRWVLRNDPIDLAMEVERRGPAFAQRLETVTSRALGPGAWRGSDQLLAALADDVAAEAVRRDPAALLPWRNTSAAWAAALVLLALATLSLRSAWLDMPTLLRRYVMPAADIRPVTTTRLRVLPGDVSIHEGDTLRVRVTARRLTEASPVLHVRDVADSGRVWSEQVMSVTPDGNFESRLRDVEHDIEYYVSGGDATSETFVTTVLHKPAVARFRVRYAYPPYTGLTPLELDSGDGSIDAPVGTEITLTIDATEPLDVSAMTIGAESVPMTVLGAPSPNAAVARFTVRESRRYTIRMASKAGASGAFRGGTIRAIADRPPVARFREAQTPEREAGERDVLPVAFQSVDDYGLARLDAEVLVTRAAGGSTRLSTAVPIARAAKQEQGVFMLDLPALGAKRGDTIELRFRAEDRAGQFDLSSPMRWKVSGTGTTVAREPAAPVATPTTQHVERSVPLDPPGFEDALRVYFEAMRGSRRE